ncbi:olfactory receptor 51H1-like [Vombatus ursinus]|uniref:olfactory receptor 51H1-like n=1 Tax=Vombatus ursinus TaxID=29139 RepID=UPI000FFDA2EA|nr:olfactory receptor 51H1-like [Vombatus ursinus]
MIDSDHDLSSPNLHSVDWYSKVIPTLTALPSVSWIWTREINILDVSYPHLYFCTIFQEFAAEYVPRVSSLLALPVSATNQSFFQHLYFVLTGIPGLEKEYYWMAFPLGFIYVIAILGNGIIISTIKSESSLHIPMYYFLCMLALADLGLALCTLPSTLGIFWFNYKVIAFDACLVQMYFIHTFSAIESGVLVAMAFDRVVAIRNPLRYGTILTGGVVCRIGAAILTRAVCVVFPVPFLIKRLPFYHSNVLSHSFCLHQDVMRLACASTCVNSLYGLIAVIFTKGSDSLSILLSYAFILCTVLSIASGEGQLKALNTCVSHICAVLIFYVPLIGVSVIHRFGKHLSPLTHTLMANAYLLVPPVLNPVVYTVKTKEIRRKIIQIFTRTKITVQV